MGKSLKERIAYLRKNFVKFSEEERLAHAAKIKLEHQIEVLQSESSNKPRN